MQELFPIVGGVLIGLGVQQIRNLRVRAIVLVALCLLVGALASFLSGELEVSWGFISVDALLVWGGALAAILVSTLWRRRTAAR